MPALLLTIVVGLLRHALTAISAWLISHGIITADQNAELIAGLGLAVAGIVWQVWAKVKDRREKLTMLAAKKGSTEDDVKAEIKAGNFVPAATASDAVPVIQGTGDGRVPPRRATP